MGRQIVNEQTKRTQRKATVRRVRAKSPQRGLPIVANQIYERREAAQAARCAVITLVRAYDSGNLGAYRIGRSIKHSGQHLLDWLESGGKTGWHRKGAEV